jgi:hypothetical protein
MNIVQMRHRAANVFLRLTGGFFGRIARLIHGPLNPEELYVEKYSKGSTIPLTRAQRHYAGPSVKRVHERPIDVPSADTPEEDLDLGGWLAREATAEEPVKCEQ